MTNGSRHLGRSRVHCKLRAERQANARCAAEERELRSWNQSPAAGVAVARHGVVGSSDYPVWRDNLGAASTLSANGDNTGASLNVVYRADYDLWLDHLGDHAGDGGLGSGTVPEPSNTV